MTIQFYISNVSCELGKYFRMPEAQSPQGWMTVVIMTTTDSSANSFLKIHNFKILNVTRTNFENARGNFWNYFIKVAVLIELNAKRAICITKYVIIKVQVSRGTWACYDFIVFFLDLYIVWNNSLHSAACIIIIIIHF